MREEYSLWIKENVPKDPTALCKEYSLKMHEAFPELELMRGHVHIVFGAKRKWPHWWLKTDKGIIVDPTKAQFPGILQYEEHVGAEPKGKCVHCGEYSFEDPNFCSDACSTEFMSRLNGKVVST